MSTLSSAVPKAWLAERGFAPEDVVLYRYDNGTWVLLPTARNAAIDDSNGSEYHFVSFSHNVPTVFAVAAEGKALPTPTPTAIAEAAEPTPENPFRLWFAALIVIAVLALAYFLAQRETVPPWFAALIVIVALYFLATRWS